MKAKILFYLIFIILHSALAGCGQNLSAVPVSTTIPTKSPFLTKTPVPVPSTAMVVANTPMYSKDDFLELYRTNGNCQLPCWWGIVPGKTTVDQVKSQFALYGELITFQEYQDKVIMLYPSPSDAIDYNISSVLKFNETGTVTSISLDPETAMFSEFNPTYLVTNFGKPDQVEISSQVTMLYEKQKIFAMYDINTNPDTNQFCFSSYDSLELWSSDVDSAFPHVKNQNNDHIIQAIYDAFQTWKGSDTCFSY
jgi:hypothetical protein